LGKSLNAIPLEAPFSKKTWNKMKPPFGSIWWLAYVRTLMFSLTWPL
jgi:hypothetical protein